MHKHESNCWACLLYERQYTHQYEQKECRIVDNSTSLDGTVYKTCPRVLSIHISRTWFASSRFKCITETNNNSNTCNFLPQISITQPAPKLLRSEDEE